jgi:predicted GNAT family acetyltransferase/translation elongation factor P/translation initiation factor 5A
MTPILTALGSGISARKILEFLSRKSPDIGEKITKALASGLSAEKVLGFFSKDQNFDKLKQSMESQYSMDNNSNPLVQAQNVRSQNLGQDPASALQRNLPGIAGGIAASVAVPYASRAAQGALSRALPASLTGVGSQSPGSISPSTPAVAPQNSNIMPQQQQTPQQQNPLSNPSQPPVNGTNIPKQQALPQDKVNPIDPEDYLSKKGVLEIVKSWTSQGIKPEAIEAMISTKNGVGKEDPELLENIRAYAQKQPPPEETGQAIQPPSPTPTTAPEGKKPTNSIDSGSKLIENPTKGSTHEIIRDREKDASKLFGEGSREITYKHPESEGYIKVLQRENGPSSVLELYVPEKFRKKGIGKALQEKALQENPELMGQVSSKSAAKNAYEMGRRPVDSPNATLEEVYKKIDEDSSVNLISKSLQPEEKVSKGSIVETPDGVGEVKEIRNGKALVEVDGKMRKVLEEELMSPGIPQADLATLHDELIEGIKRETGKEVSRHVETAGYDPEHKELIYRPWGDKEYVYDNIDPEDVEMLTNLLTQRKTTGENFIGAWEAGTESPIGAAMHALITKIRNKAKEEGKEKAHKRRYESVYSAYEPAQKASKQKKDAEKKRLRDEEKRRKAKEKQSLKHSRSTSGVS